MLHSAPQIDIVDDCYALGSVGNVHLQLWLNGSTPKRARTMRAHAQQFLTHTQGDVGAIIAVGPKCPVPDSDAREQSVRFLRDLNGRAAGVALVFLGDGFLAAASRLAMMGMMAAARCPFDYTVAKSLALAEEFLLPRTPGFRLAPGKLAAAIEEMSQGVDASSSFDAHA